MKAYDKWVTKNVNRLDNKNVIITGATGTLGYYISYYYLLLGCNLIMAVRNLEKGNMIKEKLLKILPNSKISVEYLDISKFNTIDKFIERIKDISIDILINNAGAYYLNSKDNESNMEIHFATNFFGPYLLTEKIISKIKETKGKIIFIGSLAYSYSKIDYDDIYAKKTKDKTKIYGRTKRLVALYSLKIKKELAEFGIGVELVHPGASATELFSPQKGNLPKIFYKICIPVMKLFFPKPSKAVLSAVVASNRNTNYGYWIGPRGAFHIWGYPKQTKLVNSILKDEEIEKFVKLLKSYSKNELLHKYSFI